MKFLQKRPVAAVIMVLAILAGIALGQARKPAGEAGITGDFNYVVHNEGSVLTQDTIKYVEEVNESLFAQTGAQIVVDVVKTTGSADIADYAEELFTRLGIGSRERNNGILLVLALENLYYGVPDGDYYVAWGRGFSDAQQARIESTVLDTLESGFAAKQYDQAVRDTFDALIAYFQGLYSVTIQPGYFPDTSGSYNALAGGYASTAGAVAGSAVLLGGLAILIFVLAVWWIAADAFRYQRYRRRYLGPGMPPPPRYYPIFWGRPRVRRSPPPPRAPRPPQSGGLFGGGAGRSSGSFSGGGSFGGGAGRSSKSTFSSGGSFGGGAGRTARPSSSGGARRTSSGGVKRSSSGGMHRTGGSRGGGRRR
ncbi:MAG: TPM domain-containing protein [Oscillibacter sp.]|nr:TPM domain-containing protein [Oscillibacter sp.]